MISYETRLGRVELSLGYLSKLIGYSVSSCFGVSGMVPRGTQWWREMFSRKEAPDKGIVVKGDMNGINVDLHIVVTYGVNINAIAKSIVEKVKYTVEENTGIKVENITVHIDGMKAE